MIVAKAIALVLFLSTSLSNVFAQPQQQVSFRRYGVSEGLSNNAVYAVVQDHLGFMWFGTKDGLNRFDGYTYKHYKNGTDSNSISNNTIRCLFRDSKNILWVGTDDGLNSYDHVTNSFKRYQHNTNKNSISSNYISSIAEGSDGLLYVGTYGGGVNAFDKKTQTFSSVNGAPASINALVGDKNGNIWIGSGEGLFAYNTSNKNNTAYRNEPGNETSISGNDVLSLYIDSHGTLWIGVNGAGLNAFDATSKKFTRYAINDPTKDEAFGQFSAFAIAEDNNKQLWVGTFGGGVYNLDLTTKRFNAYRFSTADPGSLSNNKVRSLYVNTGGTLWVGTERGVNSFSRSRIKFTTSRVDFSDPSLANNNVNAISQDANGNLWIGVYGGLNFVDASTHAIKTFGPIDGLSSDNVQSILLDGNTLWIGTDNGLDAFDVTSQRVTKSFHQGDGESLSNNFITCLAKDKSGALWIGTKGGGLNKLTNNSFTVFKKGNNTSLSNNNVRSLHVDNNNVLWIGTDDGLNKLDESTKSFTVYHHESNNPNSISNNAVNAINDINGTIWIGTDNGLNALKNDSKTFTRYTDQLPDPSVSGILVDDSNTVWFSTGRGIVHLIPASKNIWRIYDERDGLQNRYNNGACFKAQDGKLYFGGNDGYNVIDPHAINHNAHQPNTVITSLKINDVDYAVGDTAVYLKHHVNLEYNQNALAFEFAALDYVLPEKNRFMYKLEGVDADWKDAGSRRYVSYANLAPGTYTFLVSGTNNDNITNVNPAKLTFVIKPPFWKTWWFLALCAIALIGIIYLYIAYRTQRLMAHNRELAVKVEQRTAELKTEKEKVEHKSIELEKTLNHLKDTQEQLVQSEKMASLGQLTAGIAHEIKNPLNFVNNFAQLSAELIDEIATEKDEEEKTAMMQDLKKNLEKINHHGKRADSIVQSMLQHSRGSTGEKQPLDVNKLCDEYMDLAFHGMRAVKQTFNCAVVKNFDPSVPRANAVPQDISRVVLNLLNNAFYAVKDKKDAKVEVSTSHNHDFVIIKVRDNGSGMPDDVKHKIFEPFFTTKPTGEGTGLGLSLSFDIVRAHGGEIKVESEAGKGTEFTVSLPMLS